MEYYNLKKQNWSKRDNYRPTFTEKLKDAFNPKGRMRRRDYILVNVALVAIMLLAFVFICIIARAFGLQGSDIRGFGSLISIVYVLAFYYVGICTIIKRLHDADCSGWYILIGLIPIIGLYLIYLTLFKWKSGPNKYGSDPRKSYESQYKNF